MISERVLLEAITRVENATQRPQNYPVNGTDEASRVISTYASEPAHVMRAAAHLIEGSRWTPLPADWVSALQLTREQSTGADPADTSPMGCERCDFSGFIAVERRGYSAVTECECRKTGKAIKRPDTLIDADPEQVRCVQRRLAGLKLGETPRKGDAEPVNVAADVGDVQRHLFEVIAGARSMQRRAQYRREQIADAALAAGVTKRLDLERVCAESVTTPGYAATKELAVVGGYGSDEE